MLCLTNKSVTETVELYIRLWRSEASETLEICNNLLATCSIKDCHVR